MASTPNYNLPYPDDYSSVADVPEAIKDLAEAADEALGDKYEKPSGGIPSTDLSSEVQTSLEKADTAMQSTDIESTITSSSTNTEVAGAKAVYDYVGSVVGDINSLLDQMNREVV